MGHITKPNKLVIFLWRTYLLLFQSLIGVNKTKAMVGDVVCIRYNNYRYAGLIGMVVNSGYSSYNLDKYVHHEEDNLSCHIRFDSGLLAFNFTPDDYYIIKRSSFKETCLTCKYEMWSCNYAIHDSTRRILKPCFGLEKWKPSECVHDFNNPVTYGGYTKYFKCTKCEMKQP